MSNGYFNNSSKAKPSLVKGTGADPAPLKGSMSAPFREKPGFKTSLPGKSQGGDRSAGVKRAKVYPGSEGL